MRPSRIVVLSSYRTGSTAFCDILARHNQLTNHDEYFHDHQDQKKIWSTVDITQLINKSNYVIKIMPDQIREPQFSALLQRSWVLGIHRRNFLEQLVSYVICQQTQHWRHQQRGQIVSPYLWADNPQNSIEHLCDQLTQLNNKFWQELRPLCHMVYAYEDLVDSGFFRKSQFVQNQKPENHDQVTVAVSQHLDLVNKSV